MLLLGIETSTRAVSSAIAEDGVLLGQNLIHHSKARSGNLVESIDSLMKSLEVSEKRLDGIAVSIGPGSYTGLRVGLSVAKSLAYCWEKPLVAVNSLDSLAQKGKRQSRLVCPLIRFRRNEYYYAFYGRVGPEVERQSEYSAGELQNILGQLVQPTLFLGDITPADTEMIQLLGTELGDNICRQEHPEAHWIAVLGEALLRQGVVEDINMITPFYMHEFPVQT